MLRLSHRPRRTERLSEVFLGILPQLALFPPFWADWACVLCEYKEDGEGVARWVEEEGDNKAGDRKGGGCDVLDWVWYEFFCGGYMNLGACGGEGTVASIFGRFYINPPISLLRIPGRRMGRSRNCRMSPHQKPWPDKRLRNRHKIPGQLQQLRPEVKSVALSDLWQPRLWA